MATKTKCIEYHVIDVIIVLISILITEVISCLTSQTCKRSIQNLGDKGLPSTSTTASRNGKAKSQSPSQSTKQPSATVAQRKGAGGSPKVSQKGRTASSTRSKRSKPSSTSATSTKPGSSQALERLLLSTTGKSVLLPIQQDAILRSDHTTVEHDTRETGTSKKVDSK